MTSRTARALLVARLDRFERAVVIALIGAGRALAERDLVVRAQQFGDQGERRYRRAVARLRRDEMLAEAQKGQFVIAEPGRWTGRLGSGMLATLDAIDGPVPARADWTRASVRPRTTLGLDREKPALGFTGGTAGAGP